MTLKGYQRSSEMVLGNSIGYGNETYFEGPNSTMAIFNSTFYSALVVASNSIMTMSQSEFYVFGVFSGVNGTTITAIDSAIYVTGGLFLEDTTFAIEGSSFGADGNASVVLLCNVATEPVLLDSGIRGMCDFGFVNSQFEVRGGVLMSGSFARMLIAQSGGIIGSSGNAMDFVVDFGATVTILQSELTIEGDVVITNRSVLLCAESTVVSRGYIGLSIGSFFYATNSAVSMDQSLVLGQESALVVANASVFVIAGAIIADSSQLIAEYGGRFELTYGGFVLLTGGALMNLRTGGALVGAGSINGTLVNDGGIVTSLGSNRTEINVGQYNSSSNSNSTLATTVGSNGGNVTSSTTVNSQFAFIGGAVVVNISSTLNQQLLANATSLGGGVVLISATQNLTGSLPRLFVQLSDGSTAEVLISNGSDNGCGYRLEQTSVSLSLVFDQYGCSKLDTPTSSAVDPFRIGSAVAGWVIPVAVVAGVVALALIAAAVVWFVPSLRAKIIPGAASSYHRRKLKNMQTL
jgi:hypothetical protein